MLYDTTEKIRLDRFLATQFPAYSRTYFQYLIENNFVLVNGERMKKRGIPSPGDEIDICFQLTPEISLEPEAIPLDILFEDDHLLAINKPKGLVVHPAVGHPNHTFVNALLHHCKTLPQSDTLRPGIVHRLDKDTTGILLAAKTTPAHQKLISQFSERKVEKRYLALTFGTPKEGRISAPIGRHKVRRQEMCVTPEGKEAITEFTLLKTQGELSLIEAKLITGRTHQIRVHLKHLGAPVVGDPVYGSAAENKRYGIEGQLLHAHHIAFTHPITEERVMLSAPLPDLFQNLLNKYSL